MINYNMQMEDECFAKVNATGDPTFISHTGMARVLVKMRGSAMGRPYDLALRQRAREMVGGTAMYDLPTSLSTRLNASSPLRQEIEVVLQAVDNIEVPS